MNELLIQQTYQKYQLFENMKTLIQQTSGSLVWGWRAWSRRAEDPGMSGGPTALV